MAKKPTRATPNIIEEPEEIVESIRAKTGVVTDCVRLNLREAPALESKIVCTIECLSEVQISEGESTNDFYKVYLASGINGFCMKKFISIRS